MNLHIKILQIFYERSLSWIECILQEKLVFSYILSCPFSDNSKVTDFVIVYKASKISPKHSNGDYVWGFVERVLLFTPGRCIVFFKYFTSFMSVNSEFLWENILKVYHAEVYLVNFLVSILVFFALSNQKSTHNNYHPKFLYFCLVSFSRYNILYQTLSTLGAKAF